MISSGILFSLSLFGTVRAVLTEAAKRPARAAWRLAPDEGPLAEPEVNRLERPAALQPSAGAVALRVEAAAVQTLRSGRRRARRPERGQRPARTCLAR